MAFKAPGRVLESFTTLGTGAITLGGAVQGYRTFSSAMSNADTCHYFMFGGSDWEEGYGTYASGVLTRTTVLQSSNANSAVNWGAGTKYVGVGLLGLTDLDANNLARLRQLLGVDREKLTASRTYYVRTDGSDANDGLADNSGGAFLTIQKAMDVIGELDIATYNVTVNVRAGTYTSTLNLRSIVGSGSVSFIGDETTPANVAITAASGRAINSITHGATGTFVIAGFKLTGASTNDVIIGSRCRVTLRNNEYAGTSSYRVQAYNFGYVAFAGTANVISGGGSGFILCLAFGYVEMFSITFTLGASVTYAVAFVVSLQLGFINSTACTFTLGAFSVTGSRYSASLNGVIASGGGGASYFPGSTGGSTATGGQYS